MSMLPATARSKPPDKKPPTIGIPLPIAYFAVLRTTPSYVADVMPCRVKKIPNAEMQMPIIHLLILLKNALNLLIFNSFVRFPAIENAIIVIVSGKTTVYIVETIVVEKNATAGRHTDAETTPPLADINVKSNGNVNCICFCIACTAFRLSLKHSVKTASNGIKADT